MKILMTGASGRIGSNVVRMLDNIVGENHEIYLLQHRTPVNREVSYKGHVSIVASLPNTKEYDVALHFAGNLHTSRGNDPVNYHEFQRDNIELTKRVCASSCYVLFASTDNVFSGMNHRSYKESDPANPSKNFYGQTKAEAEKIVLDHAGATIRFQSLLGISSNLIVDRIFNAIEGKPSWSFWNDQYMRPSFFDDLLLSFRKAYEGRHQGVYHVSCSGKANSRAEIAKKVLKVYVQYGIERKIESIAEETCNVSDFPRRLVLDTTCTRQALGINSFTDGDEAIRIHVLRVKKPSALYS